MVSNLSTVYERTMQHAEEQGALKGRREGSLEGRLEVAQSLLAEGMTIAKIAKLTKLSEQELKQHFKQQS